MHQHNFSEFEKTLIELKLQRQEDPEMMNIKMIQRDMLAHLNRKTISLLHSVDDLNKSSGDTESQKPERGGVVTKGAIRADILLLHFKGH